MTWFYLVFHDGDDIKGAAITEGDCCPGCALRVLRERGISPVSGLATAWGWEDGLWLPGPEWRERFLSAEEARTLNELSTAKRTGAMQ